MPKTEETLWIRILGRAAYLQKQQEWKDEGHQEGVQKVAIALLNAGVDLAIISQATGISIEELKTLQAK